MQVTMSKLLLPSAGYTVPIQLQTRLLRTNCLKTTVFSMELSDNTSLACSVSENIDIFSSRISKDIRTEKGQGDFQDLNYGFPYLLLMN